MWTDFERFGEAGSGTLAFSFPHKGPPEWRQRWQAIVHQVTVAHSHDAKNALLDAFAGGHGVRTLGFVNAHAFNSCVQNPVFARDLLALDHIVRDGIGVGALYKLIGSHSGLNLNGTDLLPELIARFAGRRIALFGTRLPFVDRVAEKLRIELGCDVITADGFQPDGHYLKLVATHRPALVILGMGMPKQERVARQMKHGLNQDVAIVCGGAILDFLSGHVPRAPWWMRRFGLEWAYRLSLEPKRLFGRYIFGNPLFLLRSTLLALRPTPAASKERSLPERPPSAGLYGIGGPVTTMVPPRPVPDMAPPRLAPEMAPPRPGTIDAAEPRRAELTAAPLAAIAGVRREPGPMSLPQATPRAAGDRELPRETAAVIPIRDSAVSVFSANRPVVARDDLFGRERDLDRLLAWVLDQSGNALIYGPRGYGKTSLVRVFGEIADSRDHLVLYASCSRSIDFDALMRSYLGEIAGPLPAGILNEPGPLTVQQVATVLASLPKTSLVIIIDEFDRIERGDTRQNIVELIKDVSDLTAAVRFVLVGVATDATAILGYHPSVQRCITCVPLARLEPRAIEDLFSRKARADRLIIGAREIQTVVTLTAGSAYHAQLIGQKLVSEARRSGRNIIQTADLDRVIDDILTDAVLMDDGFARLARTMRQCRARDVLIGLAQMALAGNGDLISLGNDADHAELRRLCDSLVVDGVLLPAESPGNGPSFRFTNAFLPQLLLMIEHRAAGLQLGAG